MNDRERIVDKVRKLFNLGTNNPSQTEAQSALLMAQAMLVRHNIDPLEVAETKDGKLVEQIAVLTGLKRVDWWRRVLASVIADNFRCKTYSSRSFSYNVGRKRTDNVEIIFVGLSADVGIAKEVFAQAVKVCEAFSTIYLIERRELLGRALSKAEAKNISSTWKIGFVRGLSQEFKAQVDRNHWALILKTPKEVEAAIEKIEFVKGSQTSAKIKDISAYQDGIEYGTKFAGGHEKPAQRGPKLLK